MPAVAIASAGCRLVSLDGRLLPLREVTLEAEASGGLARVLLRQRFVNPYNEPLAATYQLPLPDDGAVVDFAFTLAGRRIAGQVERKAAARAAFEQAVIEGRTAALLEQDRSSLFTQELGNLPPGGQIEVEIEVEQLLRWEAGGWEWRWPTVVGPRYLGGPGETPDAERVEVAVADAPLPVRCTALLHIGEARTGAVCSPSHPVSLQGSDVSLSGALDRDVVVRWPVAAPTPGHHLELARPSGEGSTYGWLTLVPPAGPAQQVVARDLCLLLDTSGSMSGAPLAQLVALSKALVGGLRPGDRLEMIEFSSSPRRWRDDAAAIDDLSRADALRWLSALRASGGTAMHEAVTEALRPLRPEAQRQVVLMTDGYIGFEAEVIGRILRGLPRGARLHVVGVGSSVNRTLTRGAARAGGGHEAIVAPDEPVDAAAAELLARTGDPLWVDVSVSGSAVEEAAPRAIPDLLAGRPCRVALRLKATGGSVIVRAQGPVGLVQHELQVAALAEGSGRRVIATRFAREAVDDLELARAGGAPASEIDPAIEALGLRHRLATRLTSWVAVTEQATVDPGEPLRREVIPHELPHGVSAAGVGLRPPSGPPTRARLVSKKEKAAAPSEGSTGRSAPPRVAAPPAPGAPPRPSSLSQPAPAPAAPAPASRGGAARSETEAEASERSLDELGLEEPRATPRARPAAPIRRSTSLLQRVKDLLLGEGEPAPEAKEAQSAPSAKARPRTRLGARVVSHSGGKLILEVQLPMDVDWRPADALVWTSDGRSLSLPPEGGTTRAGRLSSGQTARLVIPWSSPDRPARITLGDLELVIS